MMYEKLRAELRTLQIGVPLVALVTSFVEVGIAGFDGVGPVPCMIFPAYQRTIIQLGDRSRIGIAVVPFRGPREPIVLAHPPGHFVNLSFVKPTG